MQKKKNVLPDRTAHVPLESLGPDRRLGMFLRHQYVPLPAHQRQQAPPSTVRVARSEKMYV